TGASSSGRAAGTRSGRIRDRPDGGGPAAHRNPRQAGAEDLPGSLGAGDWHVSVKPEPGQGGRARWGVRMLFMVIERFKGRDPAPVYARLREQGRAMPDGLRYVDSWVEARSEEHTSELQS